MTNDVTSRRPRHAFTLVEMLTVIIIIGILASLMLVAFGAARRSARNTAVKMDITQIDMALENYRTTYGDYPPDFVGTAATYPDTVRLPARNVVIRHLRKRFPRLAIATGTPDAQFIAFVELVRRATTDDNQNGLGECRNQPSEAGDGTGMDISVLTPAEALVFWFGGLPAYATTNELTGFSANPATPFVARTVIASRTVSLYELNMAQLFRDPANAAAPLSYGARDAARMFHPFVYFRPVGNPYGGIDPNVPSTFNWYLLALTTMPAPVASYGVLSAGRSNWSPPPIGPAVSPALPYVGPNGWANQGGQVSAGPLQVVKPQIIWSGLDGDYAEATDNIVNFTERATLGDEQ